MPTISLTLSTAAATELTDAFGVDYQATLPDGSANPEPKAQFARRQLIAMVKEHVLLYRRRQAAAAASASEPDIT